MKNCWIKLYQHIHGGQILNDALKLDSFLKTIRE